MNGEHPDRDDLVAFALGALEQGDERAVEAHVPSCARCTRELEALVPAVAVLGESVEQLEPPPELRDRVLATVRTEAAGEPEREERPARRRRGFRGFLLRPAVALATVAVVAAGVAGYLLRDTGGGGGVTTVAVTPAVPGMSGSMAVGENSSLLRLKGMPRLTDGEVYQVWVSQDDRVQPSSNFIPDASGRATTGVDGHLGNGAEVMITKESGPGHKTPTPPILLRATVD